MAWIKIIDEPEGASPLRAVYDRERGQAGEVANILKIHSLAPPTLDGHLALYKSVMHRPGPLSRARREMIAVVVSSVNGCHY